MRTAIGLLTISVLAACSPASSGKTDTVSEPPMSGQAQMSGPLIATCSGCHSPHGKAIVSLDGYNAMAVEKALLKYKSEAEGSTVMHRIARGFTDAQIQEISAVLGDTEAGRK